MQEATKCLGEGEEFDYLNQIRILSCLVTYKLKASEGASPSHPCTGTMGISCHVPLCIWRLGWAPGGSCPGQCSLDFLIPALSIQEATKQYMLLPSLCCRELITGSIS